MTVRPTAAAMPRSRSASRRDIWIRLLLYPGHTLPTAAAPVVVAVGLAIHDGVFAPLPVAMAFVASWLIHVAGVFTDNYELVARHGDVPEHPELLDALRDGTLTLAGLRAAIAACFAGALLTAPYLAARIGLPAVVALGAVGVASSVIYSVGPFSSNRLGLSAPMFFVMFGIVAVAGAYYVQAAPLRTPGDGGAVFVARALPPAALVLGLPVGALVTNVLLIDDLRDREFDRVKGWRTGAVRFGVRWSRAEFCALTAFAYAAPLWFWLGRGLSAWVLLPFATLPEAIAVARAVCTRDGATALFPMTPRASRLALVFSVLLAVGIAVRAT